MEAGRHPQVRLRTVRSQWNVVGLGQGGNLLHLRDAARVAAVRLHNVNRVFGEVGQDSPDGTITFAARQRNADLLLQSFESLDIPGNGRLLEKQNVVRFDGSRKLNYRRGGQGAVRVEHHRSVSPDTLTSEPHAL